jgi:hypothetical protein
MANVVTLTFKDENFSGKVMREIPVSFPSETVTIQDIIEARVRQEVDAYNNKQPEYYNGLIEPSDAEKTINGYKLKNRKLIDGEQQVYVALDAFQKNGFFVLVDHQQCTELDQEVRLSASTQVSFIKLTPLVGG